MKKHDHDLIDKFIQVSKSVGLVGGQLADEEWLFSYKGSPAIYLTKPNGRSVVYIKKAAKYIEHIKKSAGITDDEIETYQNELFGTIRIENVGDLRILNIFIFPDAPKYYQ